MESQDEVQQENPQEREVEDQNISQDKVQQENQERGVKDGNKSQVKGKAKKDKQQIVVPEPASNIRSRLRPRK